MTASLVPMGAERLAEWISSTAADYAEELVVAGDPRELAESNAANSMAQYFPGGVSAPMHEVFDVVDSGVTVGYLWLGPQAPGQVAAWWVWDVAVRPEFRGHGHGRQAMLLAEQLAKEHGATTIGLNVFSTNTLARGLYDDLGYEPVSTRMRKAVE